MRPLMPLLVLALAAPIARGEPVLVDRPSLSERLRELANALAEVESRLPPPGAPMPFDHALADRLRAARATLDELQSALARAPMADVVGEGGAPSPAPQPPAPSLAPTLDGAGFASLLARVKGEHFSRGQLKVLREAATASRFLVAQAAELLPLFTFEADRVKALEILAPRIADRENGPRLYVLFEFPSSKREAQRLLAP